MTGFIALFLVVLAGFGFLAVAIGAFTAPFWIAGLLDDREIGPRWMTSWPVVGTTTIVWWAFLLTLLISTTPGAV